jgi:HNH endonuclease/AP2 domain
LHGAVGPAAPLRGLPVEERFLTLFRAQGRDRCWLWFGNTDEHGYGRFCVNHRKMVGAHRFSYEFHTGETLGDMHIDHICHKPACVNPAHLRPVTPKQNAENHQGALRTSKSGVRGVIKRGNRFEASYANNRKIYYVGIFGTIEEAEAAVIAARNAAHTHNDRDRQTTT